MIKSYRFVCGCGFTGTYNEVEYHINNEHKRHFLTSELLDENGEVVKT